MKPAVGYVRCSTDMQAETSPEQQKQLITEWAGKNGYSIVEWFVDVGKSGTSFEKRPEFNRLKSRVEAKPKFLAVLVLDESRWGRAGANDSIYYKTHFKKVAGVEVIIIRTMANTGNDIFDTMLGAFEGGLSHEESKKKSERTLDGCLNAVRMGHSGGGTAPYGYRRIAINRLTGLRRILDIVRDENGLPALNEKGHTVSEQIRPKEEYVVWEPGDPKEIEIVKRIFGYRVQYGFGIGKIAKILNSEHIPCPRRGKWKRYNQMWSGSTIGAIIKNPTYMGARVYNRLKKKGIGKFAPRYRVSDQSQWIIVKDAHPPIVAEGQWEAANTSLKFVENGKRSIQRFDSPYLLSGLIKCSHCGFNFSGQTQSVGATGRRRKRRTYADSAYVSKGSSVCSYMSINAEQFEADVLQAVKGIVSNSDITSRLQRMIDHYLKDQSQIPRHEMDEIKDSLATVENQITSLLTLAEKGIKLDQIANRIKELEIQKQKFEIQLNRSASSCADVTAIHEIAKNATQFIQGFEQHFNDAPIAERKSMMRQLVDRIVINRERRIAMCYFLKIPKGAGKIVEEILEKEKTLKVDVPPTRFELVYQA